MSTAYEARIAGLKEALESLLDEWTEQSSDVEMEDEESEDDEERTREDYRTRIKGEFVVTLTRLIEVIRDANVAKYEDLPSIVAKVDGLLNKATLWANDEEKGPYGGSGCMPSFAHISDEGIAMDNSKEKNFAIHSGTWKAFPRVAPLLAFLNILRTGPERLPANLKEIGFTPWKKTSRLHPLSTLCAHFKEPPPTWEVADANERATTVFQARCEIDSGDIHKPIDLVLSSTGNVLALSSMGGWKNRTPYLWYYLPNHDNCSSYEFMTKRSIKADLTSTLDRILLDEERNLVFVADHKRIKSYRYKLPSGSDMPGKALRVHTMNSLDYTGPLALLQDGRFLRAGDGNIAVWELDKLQTHGETGKQIVGDKIEEKNFDTWRDDPEDIERSTGSGKSTMIKLEGYKDNDGLEIFTWHPHPSNANVMLCGMNPRSANNFCHAYDLQAEGKIASRYLGHGGAAEGFSTVGNDPQVFLTRCEDGYARLYDVRHPLPVMTIAASKNLDPLTAAVLAKPDGIPFVFASNSKTEDIKLWDIRARSLVYELATGNNTVEAMAWDDASNTLYAASSCHYIDRNGRHMNYYRMAKIPVQAEDPNTAQIGEDEERFEEESEDICWPKDAYYAEDYFGHAFDAGDHRIYKFSFKANPDPERLPHYGSATLSQGGLW